MSVQLLNVKYDDLESYINLAWEAYQDPKTRFYPVIDNREEVERIIKMALMHDQLMVMEYKGVIGILPLMVDSDQRYIQANGGLVACDYFKEFADFAITYLKGIYPSYSYLSGYPSTHIPANEYHSKRGDRAIEVLIRTERVLDHFIAVENLSYEPIHRSIYSQFNQLHTKSQGDVYWSAESIINNLDRWVVITDSKDLITQAAGAICYEKDNRQYAEVYFVISDQEDKKELLVALLSELSKQGVDEVLYMIEASDTSQIEDLVALNFAVTDDYCAYETQL